MIVNPRITDYLDALDPGNSQTAEDIRAAALAADVPVIGRDTERLLKMLIRLQAPGRILEVGTAVGYSALVMREVMPEDVHITTIENYAPRIAKARENFARADAAGRIELIADDAGTVLQRLESGSFDFVFMDAAKGQYLIWLPEILRCLGENGVLFSDNVLQGGDVTESRFAVDRRDRTIHARMREYLYTLTHTPGLTTAVVPVGDGAAVTVKGKTK